MLKAISLTQPWATLVIIGAKIYETRSWPTRHRGPLAIHASKGFPPDCRDICTRSPMKEILQAAGFPGPEALPTGALLGIVDITECVKAPEALYDPACSKNEEYFGAFGPGRFAWRIKHPRAMPSPVPFKGVLGLWNVPEAIAERLRAESKQPEFPRMEDRCPSE